MKGGEGKMSRTDAGEEGRRRGKRGEKRRADGRTEEMK